MSKLCKLIACVSILLGCCASQTLAQVIPSGIPAYDAEHYKHATLVLKEQYPEFLTAFEALHQEMASLNSNDAQACAQALIKFLPYAEKLGQFNDVISVEDGVEWTLDLEVVVTHFVIPVQMADGVNSSVGNLLHKTFQVYLAGGDASGILSEDDLMTKCSVTREQAQYIRQVLHQLYPTATLLD